MPSSSLKALAKQAGMKLSDAEKRWNKAKQIVSKEYDYTYNDPEYWALVTTITKRMIGFGEETEKTTFKQFITESNLITLYHGGAPFKKWNPKLIGSGERMGMLALGPGLYAGSTPEFAKIYTRFAENGVVTALEVDVHRIFDPRKITPSHLTDALQKATLAMDEMGLKASKMGFKSALRSSRSHQWQELRKALVDSGIDGIFEKIDDGMIEYCIYNPDAIKRVYEYTSSK